MKRFNLLLLGIDIKTSHQIVKTIYRIFRHNYVFEVENLPETFSLLDKLALDMLIVDLDTHRKSLTHLQSLYPHLNLIGVYSDTVPDVIFDPGKITLFKKKNLSYEIGAELKAIKKEALEAAKPSPRFSTTPSFSDYFKLAIAE